MFSSRVISPLFSRKPLQCNGLVSDAEQPLQLVFDGGVLLLVGEIGIEGNDRETRESIGVVSQEFLASIVLDALVVVAMDCYRDSHIHLAPFD